MNTVRWVRAAIATGDDEVLYETETALALAGWPPNFGGAPSVILALGEHRLYVIGEEALESLASAIAAAYAEPNL